MALLIEVTCCSELPSFSTPITRHARKTIVAMVVKDGSSDWGKYDFWIMFLCVIASPKLKILILSKLIYLQHSFGAGRLTPSLLSVTLLGSIMPKSTKYQGTRRKQRTGATKVESVGNVHS